jgi:predicted DNA binding protein
VSLIAELRLSGEGVTLYRALQAAPELHLELERAVVPAEGEPVLYLWATGGGFEAFEAAALDDPTAEETELVEETAAQRFYRVVVDPSETTDSVTFEQQVGASRLATSGTAEGLHFRMRFPDWAALQQYISLGREASLEVRLKAVYSAAEDHAPEQYGLSAKQLEILKEAFTADYFDVPRGTDLTALATELDISEQAASERLRRGLASLLEATVGELDDTNEGAMDLPVGDGGETSDAE